MFIMSSIAHPLYTDDEETSINVEYLAGNHVRLQYVMPNKDCYLVFENGQFRGSNPKMGNELFEMEEVGSSYALRLVNYDTASAGMGANETNMTSEGSTNTTEGLNNATEGGMNTTESSEAPVDTTDGPNDTTEGPTDTTEPSEGPTDTTEEPTGTTDEPSEGPTRCYLGFSDADSEPRCYASVDFAATRFLIIH